MFLEPWMMFTLVIAFGACAWHCTNVGLRIGTVTVLKALENDKIIKINQKTGKITRY